MSKHIKVLLFTASCIIAFVFSLISCAGEFDIVELEQVKIQYKDFFDDGHDPLVTQNGLLNKQLGKELNVLIDTNLFQYFYFNNIVHSMTDENPSGIGQFRTIAWSYDIGVRLTTFLNVAITHRSQHLLDHVWPYGHFPLQNAVLFEVNLYSKKKSETLLNF